MAKMKAVQVSKAGGPFEVVERDIPEPARGQVRIKVESCGICHSDMYAKLGAFPGVTFPVVPGHEIAGRIASMRLDWISSSRSPRPSARRMGRASSARACSWRVVCSSRA